MILGQFGVTRPPREAAQRGENWGEKGEKREKGKERKGEKRKEKSLGFFGLGLGWLWVVFVIFGSFLVFFVNYWVDFGTVWVLLVVLGHFWYFFGGFWCFQCWVWCFGLVLVEFGFLEPSERAAMAELSSNLSSQNPNF